MNKSPDYLDAQSAQAIAADPAHSAWVIANAGSGKTKVLIDRVARLLLKGADPDSILCVTYTKAAANEMLGRLYERLGAWSVMDEEKLRAELTKLEGGGRSYDKEALRKARSLFARALETPGGLRIETIHAFCSRILRRFPLEAGVSPGFQEIEEDEAALLWNEAAREAILEAEKSYPYALDAVALACGGFGAQAGIDALQSHSGRLLGFAATHGDDLARMTTTIRAALGAPDMSEANIITQAMGADLPRDALEAVLPVLEANNKQSDKITSLAIRTALNSSTSEMAWAAYSNAFFTGEGKLRARLYNADSAKDERIVDLFSTGGDMGEGIEVTRIQDMANNLNAARTAARTMALLQIGLPALHAYKRLKTARAALDFDDLIAYTSALLSEVSAAQWVLYKLDGGLTHILLDEAQDTSRAQWRLLNALSGEFFAGTGRERAGDPRTLFVVGDEKQSIFSFQGADPEMFLTERQTFEARVREMAGTAALPEMAMSFRSSPEVLTFVDTVFDTDAFDGHPFLINVPPEADLLRHTARRQDQPGCVEFWPIIPPDPEPDADWWTPVDAQPESSPKAQLARLVARRIRDMLETGETIWDTSDPKKPARRAVEPGDFLILVRKRKGGLFDALISSLKKEGLPVAGADRLILNEHIAVQDCLNLIRFALLPEDDLTLAEILRGPFCGLVDDDAHLFPLAHSRGKASLWSRLQTSGNPEHIEAKLLLESLLARHDMPPFEFLSLVLEGVDASSQAGWDRLLARLGAPARDPVEALLARAISHDATGPASLQLFLSMMDEDTGEIKRDLAAPDGEIRVMTVHGAKGLQAPVVILPDTTSKMSTSKLELFELDNGAPAWAADKKTDTEITRIARETTIARDLCEHRRLLYVALTRAEDRVIICGAWYGSKPNPGAKKPPTGYDKKSWYALCEAAMNQLASSEEASLEARVYGELPPSLGTQNVVVASPDLPAWLKQLAPLEAGTRHYAAPSSLIAGEAPIIPPFGPGSADRLKRGRLIHALLERLPELPVEEREQAGRDFLNFDKELSDKKSAEILDVTLAVLNDEAFADVFAEDGRAEVPVVGAAPELPDGMILNGRVDRLVITETDVLIVDFKTDRPAPKDASGVGAPYLAQMAAYRAVLRRAWPKHNVRCALLWTDGPKLMPLPADLLDQVLTTLRAEV